MNNAHEQLAQIARSAAERFPATPLASSHASVTRQVRLHRVARASLTSVAGIGVIGGATWGLNLFRQGESASPGAISPAVSASVESSPILSDIPYKEERTGFTVGAMNIGYLNGLPERLAPLYGATTAQASAAIEDAVRAAIPQATSSVGWIKPGQYNLEDSATLEEAAAALVSVRVADFTSRGIPADQWQEVLTKASLVEREARLDVDKPKLARVIENRLAQGMKLELDSTVKYVSPSEGMFTTDEDRAIDSPYNTFLYEGLPPGAIGSPTDASVDAVLHPAEGDWLFFVTVNLVTGETAFASTFPEHQANVAILQQWIKDQAPV